MSFLPQTSKKQTVNKHKTIHSLKEVKTAKFSCLSIALENYIFHTKTAAFNSNLLKKHYKTIPSKNNIQPTINTII